MSIKTKIELWKENRRDRFAEENYSLIAFRFMKDNPTILDDDLPDATDEFIVRSTLRDLKQLIK